MALTAWQALYDFAGVKAGDIVLIHGGAGGVGSIALQLAKQAGATVYTTAQEHNHAYVRKRGADGAIDYTRHNFVEIMEKWQPEGCDVIFDCAGGRALTESFSLLKEGGSPRA
mgnify:CR=1 FL=1